MLINQQCCCDQCEVDVNWTYSGCTLRLALAAIGDLDLATITLSMTRDGTPVASVLVFDTDRATWERYKPEPGVWTATITANCPDGPVTQVVSYTVPTNVDRSCECCQVKRPDFAVVTGLSLCCDHANGTFAFPLTGTFGTYTCDYNLTNVAFQPPANPFANACFVLTVAGRTHYFHRRGVDISISLSDTPPYNPPIARVTLRVRFYSYRDDGQFFLASVTYIYTGNCQTGVVDRDLSDPTIDGRVIFLSAPVLSGAFVHRPCGTGAPSLEIHYANL